MKTDEILDEGQFGELNVSRSSRERFFEFLPLLILDLFAIETLFILIFFPFIGLLTPQITIGLVLLGASNLAYVLHKRAYRYLMVFTLLLGLIGIAMFSRYSIAFIFIVIPIQLLPVPSLTIFLSLYKNEVQHRLREWFGITDEMLETEKQSKIRSFKRRFEKLSDAQILLKLSEKLTKEATDALEQIKEERGL